MTEQYLKSIKVGFIGGGNMASAIGAGLIRKGKRTCLTLINIYIYIYIYIIIFVSTNVN